MEKWKYKKIENTLKKYSSKFVLTGAKHAYPKLSEREALPHRYSLLSLCHPSNSLSGSEENAPCNCRFPKLHTRSYLKSAISLSLSNSFQQFQQIHCCCVKGRWSRVPLCSTEEIISASSWLTIVGKQSANDLYFQYTNN